MTPNLNIHINSMDGTQMAARINGIFEIDSCFFHFVAVAFGRIGGQNIGVQLSDDIKKRIKNLGYDPENIIIKLQQDLLAGQLTLPEGLKKESFIDD